MKAGKDEMIRYKVIAKSRLYFDDLLKIKKEADLSCLRRKGLKK